MSMSKASFAAQQTVIAASEGQEALLVGLRVHIRFGLQQETAGFKMAFISSRQVQWSPFTMKPNQMSMSKASFAEQQTEIAAR